MGVCVSVFWKEVWRESRNTRLCCVHCRDCYRTRTRHSDFDRECLDANLLSEFICLFLRRNVANSLYQGATFSEKALWDAGFKMSSTFEHEGTEDIEWRANAERKRAMFLLLLLIIRLLAVLNNGILTSSNIKKNSRTKYCSEKIAIIVLWCSGDVERNPGPACNDLRDFCKKMISLLVIRYWESVERKPFSQADYKKRPDDWPENAWFGDPSKCNKRDRDTMLELLLDTCCQHSVDVPNEWLSLTAKYRKTLDKNCSKSEKEQYAGDLRAWVKNLRSKEIVDQTFDKLLDVPAVDKNVIIRQIFDKLKKHVPDLHSNMLRSQIVEKSGVALQNLESIGQMTNASLNLGSSSDKGVISENYVAYSTDSKPDKNSWSNDMRIQESIHQMPSSSFGMTCVTNTSHNAQLSSSDYTNGINREDWLDDITVENLNWIFADEKLLSPSDYLQNSDTRGDILQNPNNINQCDAATNKANPVKRKCTTDGDDIGPSEVKRSALLTAQNIKNIDEASWLETGAMFDVDTTLNDIIKIVETNANVRSRKGDVPVAGATGNIISDKPSRLYEYDVSDAILQWFCE